MQNKMKGKKMASSFISSDLFFIFMVSCMFFGFFFCKWEWRGTVIDFFFFKHQHIKQPWLHFNISYPHIHEIPI